MLRTTVAALLVALLVPLGASGQDIIISEFMPDPSNASDSDGEYIELFNTTSQAVSIDGWDLQDANAASNAESSPISGVTVPAGGFEVICRNTTTTENGGVNCADNTTITLNNGGDDIILRNAADEVVDQLTYGGSGWPDPTGASVEYIGGPSADNSAPSNWQEATTKKGDFAGDSQVDDGSPNANATGGQLPVELAVFDVTAGDDRARLVWRTTSETNNAGFAVQHRDPSASGWQKLGFVSGEGTTSRPQSYRFTTDRLSAGTHTFRLKQVDADGTTHVHAPETVSVRGEVGLRLVGAHPIQKGEPAEVSLQVGTRQPVTVALYDALGQRVRTITTTRATPAQPARTTVSTTGLASGVYFLRAQGSSFERTKKLTVVR